MVAGLFEETRMMTMKQPYHLRLLERFFVYAPDRGLYVSKSWPEGAIITDPDEIALLEAQAAPAERIELIPETPTHESLKERRP
jgi:hypothetical protein